MANNNQIYKMSNAGGFKSLNRYYDMLAGNTVWSPWEPQGAYDALATVTVPSGGAASVTFAGIPTGYKHLQMRGFMKADYDWQFRYNGDAGNNYTRHLLYGAGSSAASAGYVNTASAYIGYGDSPTQWGSFVVDILDYTSTTKNKVSRSLMGWDNNGSGFVMLNSSAWLNTSAVTSITVVPQGTIQQYSQISLYGVK